jgi:hypothetical protein
MLLVHDGQWNRNPAQLGFPSIFVKILTVDAVDLTVLQATFASLS